MNSNVKTLVFRLWPLALSACTGLSLGENLPGSDVYLGDGSIAVDDRTETSFVLASQNSTTAADGTTIAPKQTLFAVDPDFGLVRKAADLSDRTDPRLLFPESGLLIMSEIDSKDRLELFDNITLAPKKTVDMPVRYHGTRMSPSRKFVAVADNTSLKAPIHIIETDSLETHIIPHDGEWLEAMFLHQSDTLVAIVFYDMDKATAKARLLSWSMNDVRSAGYMPDATGLWAKPTMDIEVPGVTGDYIFSFTWVGVSPNDKQLVFPVRKVETDANMNLSYSYELLVVDPLTQEVRTVAGAQGPVGFTPDSSTIVSYGDKDMNGNQELWLVDSATLAVDSEPVTLEGGITYFISNDGNFVVVAGADGKQRLVLFDVDKGSSTQMAGPGVGLNEFVSRPSHKEMWIVDNQALFQLDLAGGAFESVKTSFAPEHINVLPKHDKLVLDDATTNNLIFFDPTTKEISKTVELPVTKN